MIIIITFFLYRFTRAYFIAISLLLQTKYMVFFDSVFFIKVVEKFSSFQVYIYVFLSKL